MNLCLNNFTQLLIFFRKLGNELDSTPLCQQQQQHPQHHPPNIPPNIPQHVFINPTKFSAKKKSKKQQGGSVFIHDASVPRSVTFLRPIRFVLIRCLRSKGPRVKGGWSWVNDVDHMVCVWGCQKKRDTRPGGKVYGRYMI